MGPQAYPARCGCRRGPSRPRGPATRGSGIHRDHGLAAVPAPGAFRHGRRAAQRAVHRAAGAGPGQLPAQVPSAGCW
ncbi:hypothetical protein G6F24_017996 [Rhizopus arrhizus]|nr:hypothetical protein G6F24_017996 [Rhizopus arrhizus]